MEQPKLGRYAIQSELGRGAMGVVYKATDSVLERTVAIKTVNMNLSQEEAKGYEARFYQEARSAGSLNHPNIVTIYDVGRVNDVIYMAMEFIEGVELRSLVAAGRPLPVTQAISIAAQVAEGLAHAHDHGVVHRDIKPANIMVVQQGPVKITDFGIARMRASSAELTQTGMMLGSPKYMSPEQVIGKRADHRSDIFSLGVILYETLCGSTPFNGENVTALMYQIVNFVPPAPSTVNSAVPELLDYIVAKMLAKPVDERYQSGHEVARDLRQCEQQLGINVNATQPPLRTLPAATLAAGANPELALTHAESKVIAQTVSRTRGVDAEPAPDAAPLARGVSHSFDSLEATQRLAVLTGTAAAAAAAAASATATATATQPKPAPPPQPVSATAPGTIEVGPTPARPASPAEAERQTATQAIGSIPRPATRTGWRRRDWLLVGGAALAGVVAAGAILKKRG
ncbi:MAG TPA: serine/threonine-protein kinase [Burkholderiales bacterium]|jgi:serine/threonine-protein kinase